MKNYEAEKLKKIIQQKEHAMKLQIEETDRLRKENLTLKGALTQCYKEAYNDAISHAIKEAKIKEVQLPMGYDPRPCYKSVLDEESLLKLLKR